MTADQTRPDGQTSVGTHGRSAVGSHSSSTPATGSTAPNLYPPGSTILAGGPPSIRHFRGCPPPGEPSAADHRHDDTHGSRVDGTLSTPATDWPPPKPQAPGSTFLQLSLQKDDAHDDHQDPTHQPTPTRRPDSSRWWVAFSPGTGQSVHDTHYVPACFG